MIAICYVVDAPFLGGAELYVSRLASALDRGRFAPRVLIAAGRRDAALAGWAAELAGAGIPVESVPMRLPFHPADAVRLWRRLEGISPDVVHVNMPGPYDGQMGLVLPLARAAGARTVVTEHLPMVERLWKRASVKAFSYRFLDAAVTMTRANAGFLVARQGVPRERVRVVPNGVASDFAAGSGGRDGVRRELGIPAPVPVLVYVGNILLHKGLYRVLEALSMVGTGPAWHLVVVGTGPDEARCRERSHALSLDGRVSFLGARSSREVAAVMSACDVLVLPSEIEGLPYTVLEAMACSLPVIAGRVFGLPEAVEDGITGRLVNPADVGEIAAAIDALLGDEELRRRMGEAGRRRFERDFTLSRQVRTMEHLYEELVRGRARRGKVR